MRCVRDDLLHDGLDFGQFTHEVDFVVQTASRVDDDNVGILRHSGFHRVESHRSGVGTLTLLNNGHTYPLSPNLQLRNSSRTESVGSTKHDLLARLLKVVGQLADGGSLAHAVHANDHNHIRFLVSGNLKSGAVARLVLLKQSHDFLFQNPVQLIGAHILVAGNAGLDAVDNFQCGFNAHIGSDEDFRKVVILKQSLLMAYRPIRDADWRLVVSIPESDITSAEREVLIRQFWIYLFITALALAIEFILSTSLTTRLTDLSSKMTVHPADEQVGPLEKLPDTKDRDEIGQLAGTYNGMIDQIETLMDEQAATADQLRVTEVQALQAQINPHFLYNMLDMINWMALSGSGKEVSEAVQNLSKFYRLSLSKKEIYVTIEDELRHIDLYVLLQNMRFDDKIDFIIDVPDEIMECSIPKLVLQPIIENALLHGILEKNTREGTVVVMAWEEMNEITGREDIVFTISDDGVGMSKEKLRELNESLKNAETRTKNSTVEKETAAGESAIVNGSGIAVTNTHLRLVLLYGHGYGLTFRSEEGSGTEVEVRIPKQTGVTR